MAGVERRDLSRSCPICGVALFGSDGLQVRDDVAVLEECECAICTGCFLSKAWRAVPSTSLHLVLLPADAGSWCASALRKAGHQHDIGD